MITLHKVTLFRPGSHRRSLILDNVSLTLPAHARVGILAARGSGKSIFARLLSGIENPDQGWITRSGDVSWPLGFAGFFNPFLTTSENIGLIAELCGVPPRRAIAFCSEFIGSSFLLDRKVEDLAPVERAILAFACALLKDWDHYIVDETISVGDEATRAKCDAVLAERLQSAGLVVLSRNTRTLSRSTDRHFALMHHRLRPVADVEGMGHAILSRETGSAEDQPHHMDARV
ncbi:MAG: ATP-binding cassette domain-containing protein [Pseudomonadota bacterium]